MYTDKGNVCVYANTCGFKAFNLCSVVKMNISEK